MSKNNAQLSHCETADILASADMATEPLLTSVILLFVVSVEQLSSACLFGALAAAVGPVTSPCWHTDYREMQRQQHGNDC